VQEAESGESIGFVKTPYLGGFFSERECESKRKWINNVLASLEESLDEVTRGLFNQTGRMAGAGIVLGPTE
jgi:hypothetical protein